MRSRQLGRTGMIQMTNPVTNVQLMGGGFHDADEAINEVHPPTSAFTGTDVDEGPKASSDSFSNNDPCEMFRTETNSKHKKNLRIFKIIIHYSRIYTNI
jgi:hypothetical protein